MSLKFLVQFRSLNALRRERLERHAAEMRTRPASRIRQAKSAAALAAWARRKGTV